MSSDPYWTESFDDASQLERERANAEWNEWQAELVRDRQIALESAPVTPVPAKVRKAA